jgi:ferredoxin/coenzyme F420-reducing hydrogenase delta subunit/cytochrome c551/c552
MSEKGSVFHDTVDWTGRHKPVTRRFLNGLERISLALEAPVNRIVGAAQFNPLYHTGTITVFLLIVILITGVYLTMFYQFGFKVSYEAVSKIEANLVGRIVRAVHRYASGMAVITTLLHGWRTLFQDRFRGARWLAWVSGVIMAIFVWFVGITGYWLIWDERAQLLNQTFINLIQSTSWGRSFLINYMVTKAAGTGWIFMLLVLTIHLLLSVIIGLFFWYLHVRRLSRPKMLPPRYWMWVTAVLLVVGGILVPVGMLPAADPAQIPGRVTIDSLFLFYLPAALHWSPLLFWGGVTLLVVILSAIPWLLVRPALPPIVVSEERCTGCTLCAADCPYNAIKMVDRKDDRRHKYVAEVNPEMCVSCGICIGSCPPLALTLGDQPAEPLWETAVARAAQKSEKPVKVVFTCERHALQGAKSILNHNGSEVENGSQIEVVPLTCIGMAHPDLAGQALEAGATEVQFIGCPPEDCANREGNLWLAQRLERERLPKLKKQFVDAPITTDWLPPNNFVQALRDKTHKTLATTYDFAFSKANWKTFIPALALLIVILAAQIWVSHLPYTQAAAAQSRVEIAMTHHSGSPLRGVDSDVPPEPNPGDPTRLVLEVNGEAVLDKTYNPGRGKSPASVIFEQIDLPPGSYDMKLVMFDRPDPSEAQTLFAETVQMGQGQVWRFDFEDARVGSDPAEGEKLYYETALGNNAACRICHSLQPDVTLVGPSFAGVATRAATRVPGMTAEEYLYQSITDPDAYVVEGFPAGEMVPNLAEILTEEQIRDLIAFLMTMK